MTTTAAMPSLNHYIHSGPPKGDVCKGLEQLRHTVLLDGIPQSSDGMSDLRIYIWLIFLSAPPIPTDAYLDLVRQGPSPSYAKIRNDTFRTLATDPLFRRRVTENSLTRVLNATAWKLNDAHEAHVNGWQSPPSIGTRPPPSFTGGSPSEGGIWPRTENSSAAPSPAAGRKESLGGARGGNTRESDIFSESGTSATGGQPDTLSQSSSVGYVQGMNVLAAPFLYAARSEVQAFAGFSSLISLHLPGYVRGGSMDGVHRGLALVDTVLGIVDPKLANYLLGKGLKAEIYAFASCLTLCACTPPLPEVLSLWDFLFAYGSHLNLLCIVAQLVLIRDQILESPSPNQILRQLPSLQSAKIKAMTISFLRKIPSDVYEQIVAHVRVDDPVEDLDHKLAFLWRLQHPRSRQPDHHPTMQNQGLALFIALNGRPLTVLEAASKSSDRIVVGEDNSRLLHRWWSLGVPGSRLLLERLGQGRDVTNANR